MTAWEFGERALPEQERFARETRKLCSAVLGLERAEPGLADAIRALREARLRLGAPSGQGPRVGALADGDGRVYLDHGRDVGEFNPMFPRYEIEVHGAERATGTVNFPICYEGPPGLVHGGFLGVFADSVVQHHNCAVGLTGRTRGMELRYRGPVPLLVDLDFALARTVADGAVTSHLALTAAGRTLCEATVTAVAADRTALPVVSPRR
ncbi:PaaI family thioesterase [Actinocorallia aurea]